jgi:hypothetical protein
MKRGSPRGTRFNYGSDAEEAVLSCWSKIYDLPQLRGVEAIETSFIVTFQLAVR